MNMPRWDSSEESLRELYVGSYGRLVSVVAAICGDRDAAEEAVQEAFVRLMVKWGQVSAFDDPEAWIRKVALGFVSKGRRKLRNGQRAATRFGPPQQVPPATGDAVDVQRALRQLPVDQRHVLVLVHVVGMTVEAAATELSVPVGTVKSRLSRGRAALVPLLAEEVPDHG
ncbi:MAG: polymerase, sigma-24 subunit, subfamily [Frankiales bacterium]|nr:polymerase, sigma-24 subunit, subfamily [Frankiales bacterium]